MPLRAAVLLTFFLISLPICFFRPFYGILLWTIVAFLNPQSYIWSNLFSFPWAMIVAIPTIAGFLIFCRGWVDRMMSREVLLIGALWVWFTITTIVSTQTALFAAHAPETLVSLDLRFEGLADDAGYGRRRGFVYPKLRTLMLVIAGSFGFYVLKGLPFIVLTGGAYRLYGPEQSMIADNNDFGLALNMTLPIFFFLAQTESKRWVRYLCGFMFLITIPAVFFTYSRGALLGMLVILFLMFLRLKQRFLLIPVILVGLLVAVAFAPEAWKQRMDPSTAVDASALSRFNAWTYCWNLSKDYPLRAPASTRSRRSCSTATRRMR